MGKTTVIAALIIFTVLLISVVSAGSYSVCLDQGEKIRFSKCNPAMKDYSCGKDKCSLCVNEISDGVYCPSNSCGALGSGSCSSLNNTDFDLTPPNITVNSPIDNKVYDSKSILLDIELDEKADLYYLDNAHGENKWIRMCAECDLYSRKKSLKEGFNNLTFKAVDFFGHESYKTRIFNIDSQAPRIHKTEPRSDYADGKFEIQYSEENIKNIIIYYGNEETGFRNKKLTNCTNGTKQWCSADVDLKDYDNERIQYYFEVEDITGSIKKSQIRQNLNVDTTFPVLNNPGSYYTQGTGINSRYIYFSFNITETNLYKVTYSYLDSRNITKEAVLCSRLKNNICETKKSFTKGSYLINIQITDKAGNAIGKQLEFEVDY